jgi:hypothetical protein
LARIKRRNEEMQIVKEKHRGKSTAIVLVLLMTSFMLFAIVPTRVEGQLQQVGAPTYQAWQTSVPSGVTVKNTIATEAFMSVSPNP